MSTFEALGLDPEILTAIEKLGFEHPTEIQIQAIPTILSSDQDLVALAQTGTGKTAAFGLPLIHRIRPELREPQAMVLSPTRELAMQIARDLESFAHFLPNIRIEPVYGGTPIYNQIKAIRKGVHVVVGTPGRMLDLIKRGVLDLSTVQYVVLDEADEMLNMGFKKDLDSILSNTPEDKQTLLFSATMAEEVARIAQKYMEDPYRITVGTKNAGAKKVEHHYYQVPARERYEALKRILAMEEDFYGIVFCRTRRDTEYVARKLNRDGFPADALNGDLSQAQRDKVMDRFRSSQITTLVATDVAARGLDVDDLSHVINYELPDDPEVYIHRSGRTGRAGKSGISAVIIHSRERHRIRNLERMSGKDFHQKRVPNGDEICQAQLRRRVHTLQEEKEPSVVLQSFLPEIYQELEGLSREELIQRFLIMEFEDLLQTYGNAPDLNVRTKEPRSFREEKKKRKLDYGGFIINLGEKQRVNVNRLMGIINDHVQNRHMRIGRVRVSHQTSYFEVERKYEKSVLRSLQGIEVEGVSVTVQRSQGLPDFVGRGPRKGKNGYHQPTSNDKKAKKNSSRKRKRKRK